MRVKFVFKIIRFCLPLLVLYFVYSYVHNLQITENSNYNLKNINKSYKNFKTLSLPKNENDTSITFVIKVNKPENNTHPQKKNVQKSVFFVIFLWLPIGIFLVNIIFGFYFNSLRQVILSIILALLYFYFSELFINVFSNTIIKIFPIISETLTKTLKLEYENILLEFKKAFNNGFYISVLFLIINYIYIQFSSEKGFFTVKGIMKLSVILLEILGLWFLIYYISFDFKSVFAFKKELILKHPIFLQYDNFHETIKFLLSKIEIIYRLFCVNIIQTIFVLVYIAVFILYMVQRKQPNVLISYSLLAASFPFYEKLTSMIPFNSDLIALKLQKDNPVLFQNYIYKLKLFFYNSNFNRITTFTNSEYTLIYLVLFFSLSGIFLLFSIIGISWKKAFCDELTGVLNRRAYNEELEKLFGKYSIAMLDIDHFKKFNDSYGHKSGDIVLAGVAQVVDKMASGKVFRYGGEEFVIIFRNSNINRIKDELNYLRKKISKTKFRVETTGKTKRKKNVRVTVSIGLSFNKNLKEHPEEVMKTADKFLYQAKTKGRNRVEVDEPEPENKKGQQK